MLLNYELDEKQLVDRITKLSKVCAETSDDCVRFVLKNFLEHHNKLSMGELESQAFISSILSSIIFSSFATLFEGNMKSAELYFDFFIKSISDPEYKLQKFKNDDFIHETLSTKSVDKPVDNK